MMRLVLLFCLLALPVSSLSADIEMGRQLYLTAGGYGCAVCHGPVGDGADQAGGYIRGASLDALNLSLTEQPVMAPLATVLTEQERSALGQYLASLKDVPLLSLTISEEGTSGFFESWIANQSIDVVLYNATFEQQRFELPELGLPAIVLEPLERLAHRLNAKVAPDELNSMYPSITVTQRQPND